MPATWYKIVKSYKIWKKWEMLYYKFELNVKKSSKIYVLVLDENKTVIYYKIQPFVSSFANCVLFIGVKVLILSSPYLLSIFWFRSQM